MNHFLLLTAAMPTASASAPNVRPPAASNSIPAPPTASTMASHATLRSCHAAKASLPSMKSLDMAPHANWISSSRRLSAFVLRIS